jgi:voltage-gated potassium channel Kch
VSTTDTSNRRPALVERRMSRFLHEPPSVRLAARVIVGATATIVVLSGVLMWALDHSEYPNVWVAMWWAIQTVTTVGYGDVTPKAVGGRIVASFVMLEAIALVAIVTAAITSTFVERASHLHDAQAAKEEDKREAEIERRFDDLAERLARLETMLRGLTGK